VCSGGARLRAAREPGEGTKIARGFRGQRREQLQTALADFTPAERADLARLLTKLAASWPQG